MSKLKELKLVLEERYNGQLPLIFRNNLTLGLKEDYDSNEEQKMALRYREMEVKVFQTKKLTVQYYYRKPISKSVKLNL